jgi:ATP-dependent Clp protease ATP-binding subunit ClpC
MTRGRGFKRLVRERMRKTGESYTSARARLTTRQQGVTQASAPGGSEQMDPFEHFTRHPARELRYPSGRRVSREMDPFERLTEQAKLVLSRAQDEARRAGHGYIGTEHLLLALVGQEDGIAARALGNLGIEDRKIRDTMASMLGRRSTTPVRDLPTSRVRKVIQIAFDEARRMGQQSVGTEQLLLGLMIEGEGIGAHALDQVSITLPKVRHQLAELEAQGALESRPAAASEESG